MRTVFIALILFTGITAYAADNKVDVLLGLRLGGGWAAQQAKVNSLWGVAVSNEEFRNQGYCVPLKAELLFGLSRFRIGYTFEFSYSSFINNTISTKSSDPYGPLPDQTGKFTYPIPLSFIGNYLTAEYTVFSKNRFAISPAARIGFFVSKGIVRQDFRDEGPAPWQSGFATGASINFEVKDKKNISYVFSPAYTFYTGGSENQQLHGHIASLEVAFRFRLNKKKTASVDPKPEPVE